MVMDVSPANRELPLSKHSVMPSAWMMLLSRFIQLPGGTTLYPVAAFH
ncbi:MAG: hypothetical protein ABSG62_00500 [Terracidiphilus sp.]|jgi:hypothetical protein